MTKYNRDFLVAIVFFFLVELALILGLFFAPVDRIQGEIYRIMYLHVPSAMAAFFTSAIILVNSINILRSGGKNSMHWGKAAAEVGLLFTAITLLTGSIWGRPTWGVYWTWDARLTTTLILALLYAGYLLLYNSFNPGTERNKACAVLGILIFAAVPVVYKSVQWWRTLHQPQSLFREGGSTMSPEIKYILLFAIFSMLSFAMSLIWVRVSNLAIREKIDTILNSQSTQQ